MENAIVEFGRASMQSKQKTNTQAGNIKDKGERDFDIYEYIPFRLVTAQLRMHGTLKAESVEPVRSIASLSKTEFRVIVLISSTGPISPSKIASEYGFDRAVVTRAISTLMKKNLLEYEKSASDQRSKIFRLTPKGEKYVRAGEVVMSEYAKHLDSALSPAEKRTLFRLLDKLLSANSEFRTQREE